MTTDSVEADCEALRRNGQPLLAVYCHVLRVIVGNVEKTMRSMQGIEK